MNAPQATARGTLENTPLVNLLVYVLDRRMTGTLVIEDHRYRKSAISLLDGVPIRARTAEPVVTLGGTLVEMGIIDEATKERTLRDAQSRKQLHGLRLVELGIIQQSDLEEALFEQLCRKLEWLTGLRPESVFGYYADTDYLQKYGAPVNVEPLAIVWRLVQLSAAPATVEATLAHFEQKPLRLHVNSRVGRFGFGPRERGMLDVLRSRPLPLASILDSGLLPADRAKLVLYALTITRHLDVGGTADRQPVGVQLSLSPPPHATGVRSRSTPEGSGERPVGTFSSIPPDRRSGLTTRNASSDSVVPGGSVAPGASSAPRATGPGFAVRRSSPSPSLTPRGSFHPSRSTPSPAGSEPPEIRAFKEELISRAAAVGAQTYYEILGIEQDASASAVQTAFFDLAKKWHPDRLGAHFDDVREQATRIFARMTEAHQVLSSTESRREYDKLVREGGATSDEQEQVRAVLRAATAFQKAEVLLKKGKLAEAEEEARQAHEDDPEQAEYAALYADILSRLAESRKIADLSEYVGMVNRAKSMQPDNIKVRLYRARVLKRAGMDEEAMKEFRKVVRAQPHNVEAARELRLFEMRKEKGKSTLKKLFGR